MTALVEDLLLLARLDSGRPLVSEPVDLTRLLVEAVSDARVLAPDHHWRLSLPESSVEVVGDEPRLHQVVTNLLTNARKYTPAGTTVAVSVTPAVSPSTTTAPASRPTWSTRPSSASPAETPHAPAPATSRGPGAATASACPWSRPSSPPDGGRVHLRSVPGDTTVTVDLPRSLV